MINAIYILHEDRKICFPRWYSNFIFSYSLLWPLDYPYSVVAILVNTCPEKKKTCVWGFDSNELWDSVWTFLLQKSTNRSLTSGVLVFKLVIKFLFSTNLMFSLQCCSCSWNRDLKFLTVDTRRRSLVEVEFKKP